MGNIGSAHEQKQIIFAPAFAERKSFAFTSCKFHKKEKFMKKIALLSSLACIFMSGNAAAATYNFSCSIGYPTKLAQFTASVDGERIGNKVTAYLTVPSYSYLTASNFKVSGQAFVNNSLTTPEFTAYFQILGVRGDIISLGMVAKDRSKISCQRL